MSQEEQQQEMPSKEQMMAHLEEQIEIMEKRVKLQELNMNYARARAEEVKAIAFLTQMMEPPKEDDTLTETEESSKKLKRG
jgi:adenylylsulfate kinase-like enzyme